MKLYLPLGAAAGLLALSGCVEPADSAPPPPPSGVVYVNQPGPQSDAGGSGPSETTYVPPGTYATAPSYSQDDYEDDGAPTPEEGEVEVQTVADFDEPLQPYGEWVVVGSYGRCWRPRHVESDWRPYCDGHWVDTDRGWYWQSDEPWGWATYHYGRWDYQASYGWIWIPHTRWAPAWVEWRSGGGYVGWAPMGPGARFQKDHNFHNVPPPDRNFVFVHENRFNDRVRPSTVVVNNTTIIHQTTNITNVTIVNNRVHAGGPRSDAISRATGHDVRPVQAVQLRRQIEKPVATSHPVLAHPHPNPPGAHVPNNNNSRGPNNATTNGPRGPVGNPAENHQPYGAAPQNHTQAHPENTPTAHNPNERNQAVNSNPNHQPHPTAVPAPTARPTNPPAHINQTGHQDFNAKPTMRPLQPDNRQLHELHPSPTMKPLENRSTVNVVHPTVPPRSQTEPRREPHQTVTAPSHTVQQPQQRPQLPPNQNPVVVPPHNNSAQPVGPVRGGAAQSTFPPPQHTTAPVHPAVAPQPKTVPPAPPKREEQHDQHDQHDQPPK